MYYGVSCPKLHLKSYVHKIQPHEEPIEVVNLDTEEDKNQVGEVKITQTECANDQESDDDYFNEQYPPADIKYNS